MKKPEILNTKERTLVLSLIAFCITIASLTTENPWLHRSYEMALLIAWYATELSFRQTFRTMQEISGAMIREIQKIKEGR